MPHAFTRFLLGELSSEPCWYVQREEELFGSPLKQWLH